MILLLIPVFFVISLQAFWKNSISFLQIVTSIATSYHTVMPDLKLSVAAWSGMI